MAIVTAKAAAERLEAIRRENVKRHQTAAAKNKLREDLRRQTNNRNAQLQRDRLLEASRRHNGLDAAASQRMLDLQKMIR